MLHLEYSLIFSLPSLSSTANDIININSETSDTTQPTWQNTNYGLPYFDNSSKRDITATVGQSAKLHCVVRNLGDRAVSINMDYFWNNVGNS